MQKIRNTQIATESMLPLEALHNVSTEGVRCGSKQPGWWLRFMRLEEEKESVVMHSKLWKGIRARIPSTVFFGPLFILSGQSTGANLS
ncbi:unnamed protein product [Ixodes persulcatus]